jgi:hypothetical protein
MSGAGLEKLGEGLMQIGGNYINLTQKDLENKVEVIKQKTLSDMHSQEQYMKGTIAFAGLESEAEGRRIQQEQFKTTTDIGEKQFKQEFGLKGEENEAAQSRFETTESRLTAQHKAMVKLDEKRIGLEKRRVDLAVKASDRDYKERRRQFNVTHKWREDQQDFEWEIAATEVMIKEGYLLQAGRRLKIEMEVLQERSEREGLGLALKTKNVENQIRVRNVQLRLAVQEKDRLAMLGKSTVEIGKTIASLNIAQVGAIEHRRELDELNVINTNYWNKVTAELKERGFKLEERKQRFAESKDKADKWTIMTIDEYGQERDKITNQITTVKIGEKIVAINHKDKELMDIRTLNADGSWTNGKPMGWSERHTDYIDTVGQLLRQKNPATGKLFTLDAALNHLKENYEEIYERDFSKEHWSSFTKRIVLLEVEKGIDGTSTDSTRETDGKVGKWDFSSMGSAGEVLVIAEDGSVSSSAPVPAQKPKAGEGYKVGDYVEGEGYVVKVDHQLQRAGMGAYTKKYIYTYSDEAPETEPEAATETKPATIVPSGSGGATGSWEGKERPVKTVVQTPTVEKPATTEAEEEIIARAKAAAAAARYDAALADATKTDESGDKAVIATLPEKPPKSDPKKRDDLAHATVTAIIDGTSTVEVIDTLPLETAKLVVRLLEENVKVAGRYFKPKGGTAAKAKADKAKITIDKAEAEATKAKAEAKEAKDKADAAEKAEAEAATKKEAKSLRLIHTKLEATSAAKAKEAATAEAKAVKVAEAEAAKVAEAEAAAAEKSEELAIAQTKIKLKKGGSSTTEKIKKFSKSTGRPSAKAASQVDGHLDDTTEEANAHINGVIKTMKSGLEGEVDPITNDYRFVKSSDEAIRVHLVQMFREIPDDKLSSPYANALAKAYAGYVTAYDAKRLGL